MAISPLTETHSQQATYSEKPIFHPALQSLNIDRIIAGYAFCCVYIAETNKRDIEQPNASPF